MISGPDEEIEIDGLVVRLDVHVSDPSRAAQVAETLARQAAGFATEGIVASLIVHPDRLSIEHSLDAHIHPEDPDDEEGL